MINSLKLIHFKSHKETEIKFEKLTVLCGANGVGKSSFIQSLLLLRQTYLLNRLDNNLFLNGSLYEIGSIKDALHVANQGEYYKKILFDIRFNQTEQNQWEFNADSDYNFLELLNKDKQNHKYKELALFTTNFQYISAFRSSEQVRARDFEVVQENQISYSKGKGDMVAHFLHHNGRKLNVLDKIKHPSTTFSFLEEQVSAWESYIVSSGVNIVTEKVYENQYAIKYDFKVNSIQMPEHKFSADNVGFGLSYTLPILVAILSSKPNALIIIENPEAHLHPHSISKLTELICIASQAGIQIVIETHSDHIVNGILVQCKKFEEFQGEKGIDKANVSIYQFERDDDKQFSTAIPIPVEEGGRIYNKPNGFFDQITHDLRELF